MFSPTAAAGTMPPVARRLFTLCSALSLLLCNAMGCYSTSTVPLEVYDAEWGGPIHAGQACVRYSRSELDFLNPFSPRDPCVPIVDGVAKLRVVTDSISDVQVTAPGYLPGGLALYSLPSTPPTVHLFREPSPEVHVTLPTGYRGVVKIGLRGSADGDRVGGYPRGQRVWSFRIEDPSQVNWFASPPLLSLALLDNYHAQYANGTPIFSDYRSHPGVWAFRRLGNPAFVSPTEVVYLFCVGEDWMPYAQQLGRLGPRPTLRQVESIGLPPASAPAGGQ